ncbi:MAG: T9SS type A sorting domain-containing protein [Flavobacteriaceae bacterium]
MKKIYFLLVAMVVTSLSFGQTTIFDAAGGGAYPAGWTDTNNVTTNIIDRGTYYLVEAGAPADEIVTAIYDLSTYSSATLTLDVASFGGAANHSQAKIEISDNGGATFTQVETSTTTTGSSYIAGGSFAINSLTNQVQIRISNNGTTTDERGVRLRNIILEAIGTTPEISITGSPISGLDYFEGFGPSAEGSFTVEGFNLTTDITVNAPANFEVSLTSGSGFAASVNASQTGTTTIYARLVAGLTSNPYSGDVVASASGATNQNIALSGTVSPADPQITVGGSVGNLNYTFASGGPSAEDDFTVEGLFLTSDIVVTASTGFEVSLTSGAGFVSSVNIPFGSGTVATTPVYTRLIGAQAVNTYTGDITITSTDVTTETITLNGEVFPAPTNSLVLTGVFDGPLTGGTPKGVEIFVLQDIADLSKYGVGSANNGGGTDGQEFTFPAVAATAGTYIYITDNTTDFTSFFGFAPDYTDGFASINGDDAVELFENGQVIDTFGDISTDGTGEAWDFLDGWAYRVADTGPDGGFIIGNWTFSGTNQLEGGTTNSTTSTPFPIGTYANALSVADNTIDGFSIYPNPSNSGVINITTRANQNKNVQIFDMLGKKVIDNNTTSTVNISALQAGIYIVKVTENNVSATKRLVVR